MEGPWLVTACILFTFACILLHPRRLKLWCITPPVWLGFCIFSDDRNLHCGVMWQNVNLLLWMTHKMSGIISLSFVGRQGPGWLNTNSAELPSIWSRPEVP